MCWRQSLKFFCQVVWTKATRELMIVANVTPTFAAVDILDGDSVSTIIFKFYANVTRLITLRHDWKQLGCVMSFYNAWSNHCLTQQWPSIFSTWPWSDDKAHTMGYQLLSIKIGSLSMRLVSHMRANYSRYWNRWFSNTEVYITCLSTNYLHTLYCLPAFCQNEYISVSLA